MGFVFRLHPAGLTDVGQKRPHNEDFIGYFEPSSPKEVLESGCLYVVADGVGGAAQGERASKYAVQKLLYAYYQRTTLPPGERLQSIIQEIGNDIYAYGRSPHGARMATTLVAAVVWRETLIVANVGDSRAYLLRAGEARQITQDHSLVAEMVRNGLLTEEEAEESQYKNRLTRSLGGEANPKVDIFEEPLAEGDRILLCSDGLSRYATPADIVRLTADATPEEAVQRLVDFANQQGGADNISAILIAVEGRVEVEHWSTDHNTPRLAPPDLVTTDPSEAPTVPYQTPAAPPAPQQTPAGGIAALFARKKWGIALLALLGALGLILGIAAAYWAGNHRRAAPTSPPPTVAATLPAPSQPPSPTPPPPSPTPMPSPTMPPTPAPTASWVVAQQPTLLPNVPYGCIAIVQQGDGLYSLIARFYGVTSSREGFREVYHFPVVAYITTPPQSVAAPWNWQDFQTLTVPATDEGWDTFERKAGALPVVGMGILMPQLTQDACLSHFGRWAPIAGLPAWARRTPQPSPTP